MREPNVARDKERGTGGVLDTLSAGYALVNRHPWVIAVPVLLDLFFWLGPHLSLAPLVQRSLGLMPIPAGLSGDLLQSFQEARDGLLKAGESFNLFSLLAGNFPGIPNLMGGREGIGATATATIADPWSALALSLLIPVIGMWLAALYYVAMGSRVVSIGQSPRQLWSRVWRTWWRLLGFVLLAAGVGLVLGVPMAGVILLAGTVNSSLFGFLESFFLVTLLWLQFYLFFVVNAMVVSDVGPLKAVRNSIAVVRFNLGSALGLVILIWIVTLGMPIVWNALAQNPLGTLGGILGNAYISTGLAAASMIYYRDRFSTLCRILEARGQGVGTRV